MAELPFMIVLQWARGETILARSDSLLECLDGIVTVQKYPPKPWVAEVLNGNHRIGIINVDTGDVFDDTGVVVQKVSPAIARAYDERAGF